MSRGHPWGRGGLPLSGHVPVAEPSRGLPSNARDEGPGMTTHPDVFAPDTLGPITLRNRVIKPATFEGRTPDALVTDELIEFHRRPAAGGVGMSTVAYCAVAPEGRTERGQLWMRPDAVPGLRRLTDAIHAEGAAASAQLGPQWPGADPGTSTNMNAN